MTITVGTDTYDTVASADIYWTDRDNAAWVADTTANKEFALRKAADWLDRNFRWRGRRKTDLQRLEWPRSAAFDDDNYKIGETEAPFQVKEAQFIIADLFRIGTTDLEGILTDSDVAISREKVDVIEVEYNTEARLRGQDVVSHVYLLLKTVTLQGFLLRS